MDYSDLDKDVRMEFYRSSMTVVREIGLLAIRTLVTLNSGAFVVLLTFIGNTAAQSQFIVPLNELKIAMFCFLGGLALAFLAIAYAYVTAQTASPYPSETKRADGWFVPIVVSVTAASFLVFVYGVAVVVRGVQPA